jgi:flavin reductase (DIM6/NTAB) family NADH-FMN oxidoreductase RutF
MNATNTTTSINNRVTSVGSGDTLSADDFKSAFRNHPAGVAVITADAGDGPVGLTATSVISVSASPALLVFSLSAFSSTAPALARAETLVVHLLGADQMALAKTFSTSGIDRFADTSNWSRLVTGEPVLHNAPIWLRGRIVDRMQAGDSTVVAVQVLQASVPEPGPEAETSPLVYHNRAWHRLSELSAIS